MFLRLLVLSLLAFALTFGSADAYAQNQGLDSRSAALQKAVRLLRASELGAAYEDAWAEWAESEDAALWQPATADGLA